LLGSNGKKTIFYVLPPDISSFAAETGAAPPDPLRMGLFCDGRKKSRSRHFRYSIVKQLGTPNTHARLRTDMPTPMMNMAWARAGIGVNC
jgi:hypothetical protein